MKTDKILGWFLRFSAMWAILLGFIPFFRDKSTGSYKISRVMMAYSVLITVCCTLSYEQSQLVLFDTRNRTRHAYSPVNLVIGSVQGMVVTQTLMQDTIYRYLARFQIIELLDELTGIRSELFRSTEIDQHWIVGRICRKIAISQILLVSCFAFIVDEHNLINTDAVGIRIFWLLVFFYPRLVIVCAISIYYSVLLSIQNLHFALNERLKLIAEEQNRGVDPLGGSFAKNQFYVYIRAKLNHLLVARSRIVTCGEKIQNINANLLLSIYLVITSFFVNQLYFIFKLIYTSILDNASLPITAMAYDVLMCILCLFEIYSLSEVCETVLRQSRKTQKLLLRLNTTHMDHRLKESVEIFALQMLHQPIEFTACGMFTLDYTVLFSIIAAGTSYLIILIQFEMAINK